MDANSTWYTLQDGTEMLIILGGSTQVLRTAMFHLFAKQANERLNTVGQPFPAGVA